MSDTLAHPHTGEIINLDAAVGELAETLIDLKELKRHADSAIKQINAELLARLGDRRRLIRDGYEIKARRRAEWDGDTLEGVLRDLVDRHVLAAAPLAGIIRHRVEVMAGPAGRLADQLDGRDRADVEACRTWATAGIDVAPSINLLEGAPE